MSAPTQEVMLDLSSLPLDGQTAVLGHLDARSLARAACVCRALRTAERCARAALWSPFVREFGICALGEDYDSGRDHKEQYRRLRMLDNVVFQRRRVQGPPVRNGAAAAALGTRVVVCYGGSSARVSRHSTRLHSDLYVSVDGGDFERARFEGEEEEAEAQEENRIGPPNRWGCTLTALSDERSALLFGGFGGGEILSDAWRLVMCTDPESSRAAEQKKPPTFKWESVELRPMEAPFSARVANRAFHSATLIRGTGFVAIAGGLGEDSGPDDILAVDTEKWTFRSFSLNRSDKYGEMGRAGHASAFIPANKEEQAKEGFVGRLVLAGGCSRNPIGDIYLASTSVFDALVDGHGQLSLTPLRVRISTPRLRCPVSLFAGAFLVWGGHRGLGTFNRDVWVLRTRRSVTSGAAADGGAGAEEDLEPCAWRWQRLRVAPPPRGQRRPPPREGAAFAPVPGGLRVMGGATFSDASNLAPVYDLRLTGAVAEESEEDDAGEGEGDPFPDSSSSEGAWPYDTDLADGESSFSEEDDDEDDEDGEVEDEDYEDEDTEEDEDAE
mmetsp:Transcript_11139/g.36668  ORF Transcript_11139/g.36668 Transcript_11139/m.36668 type:complete len:555 (+) Transcript_11139:40-1704(+)